MKCFRTLFVVVLAAMTSKVAYCAQIWPCPGVCFTDGAYFPDLEKGVVFLDLGLPQTERPSVYGFGFALWRSRYKTMVGAQVGLLEGMGADVYGAKMGLANSMDKKSHGLQIGVINEVGDKGSPFIGWNW